MRKVLNKIKSIHIVIIILLLILFKLNVLNDIANDLSYIEPSVDLSTIEDELRQIKNELGNLR